MLITTPDSGLYRSGLNVILYPHYALVFSISIAIILGLSSVSAQQQVLGVPPNPSTPQSVWAEGHGVYCQQSTLLPGPTEIDRITTDILSLETTRSRGWLPTGTVLGESQADGGLEFWGSNGLSVYRVGTSPSRLELTPADIPNFQLPSGYWTMDNEGFVYIPNLAEHEIVKLRSRQAFNPNTPIDIVARVSLPEQFFGDEDFIRGMKMLHSGPLLITLSNDTVLVLSRELEVLASHTLPETDVDNNPCIDEHDNVYLTTGSALYKLRWTGQALTQVWRVAIEGSGSTPTLIGTDNDPDRLIAITDRNSPMNLVLIWRDDTLPTDWTGLTDQDPRIAGVLSLDFNVPGQIAKPTENSVLAAGYDMMLVAWTGLLPRLQGQRDRGALKVRWNPTTNSLERVWVNPNIWAPNSMQAMSVASNRAYVVSVRREQGIRRYGLDILDWSTGESLRFVPLGLFRDIAFNVYGSGLQIGPNRDIVIPAPLSVIRFQAE